MQSPMIFPPYQDCCVPAYHFTHSQACNHFRRPSPLGALVVWPSTDSVWFDHFYYCVRVTGRYDIVVDKVTSNNVRRNSFSHWNRTVYQSRFKRCYNELFERFLSIKILQQVFLPYSRDDVVYGIIMKFVCFRYVRIYVQLEFWQHLPHK